MCLTFKQSETYIFLFSIVVNGGWGEWGAWDACPVTCGGGDQNRHRVCDNPIPENGGDHCTVDGSADIDSQRCNENQCDGKSTIKMEYLKTGIKFKIIVR